MKNVVMLLAAALILTGCGRTVKGMRISHPTLAKGQIYAAYQRDMARCKADAYAAVPYPRSTASPAYPVASDAPDLGSIMRGYESSRNSPQRVYQRNLHEYQNACISAKGYVVEYIYD